MTVRLDALPNAQKPSLYDPYAQTYEEREKETFEPTLGVIFRAAKGPELVNKGEWLFFALGLLLCAVNAFSVLFADNMFRRKASTWLRNAENVEPSENAIAYRNLSWFVLLIVSLGIFIVGLK